MRHGESRDDQNQPADAPERDDETQQEQQVVDPVQDVREPQGDEPQRGLVPSRIEPDEPQVAPVFERANGAVRWQEPHHGEHAQRQALEPGVNREVGLVRRYRILEQHVEHRVFPVERSFIGQSRARDVCKCVVVIAKRPVGGNRCQGGDELGIREPLVVLVQLHLIADPQESGVAQLGVGSCEVEVARATQRKLHVAHCAKRHAHEQAQCSTLRLDDDLDRHVVRNFVRG